MSIHNQITHGALLKAYQKLVGLDRNEDGVQRLGETLTPIIDLWSQPEFNLHRGDQLMGGVVDATSAAGTLSELLLLNPTGSNVLAVTIRLRMEVTTSASIAYARLNQGTLPAGFVANNSGPVDFRDPKLIATSSSRCILAQAANAAIDGGIEFDRMLPLASTPVEDRDPIIIPPGQGFILRLTTVGANRLIASARWRERTPLPGELEPR